MTFALSHAIAAGNAGIQQSIQGAGHGFLERAQAIIMSHLDTVDCMPGEDLVDLVKQHGVLPKKDDRAFGAVFQGLVRAHKIHSIGFTLRKKGHGTAGGRIWALGRGVAV